MATLLQNGKVLVAGGYDSIINASASAELYDPASGTWRVTGSLNTGCAQHTATLLQNGKVLVAGGDSITNVSASAELYDPASETWTATGSLKTARFGQTATLLRNGMVLVAGGLESNGITASASAELYDPASGTWTATGSLNTARWSHTATLLQNGKVLVAGGYDTNGISASAELYDSTSGTWTATGSLNTARAQHTATLLQSGKVLVAGGNAIDPASAELYDPASGTWTVSGSLKTARYLHTATVLQDGKVLVAGGFLGAALANAELWTRSPLEPTARIKKATFSQLKSPVPKQKITAAENQKEIKPLSANRKGRTMNSLPQSKNTTILPVLIALTLGYFGLSPHARAGSATWNLPIDNRWNNPLNWTPATVPNGPTDVATFENSNTTALSLSGAISVDRIAFEAGATAFTISYSGQWLQLGFDGAGVMNDSGVTQNFIARVTSSGPSFISFYNSATAGDLTMFTIKGGEAQVYREVSWVSSRRATPAMACLPAREVWACSPLVEVLIF